MSLINYIGFFFCFFFCVILFIRDIQKWGISPNSSSRSVRTALIAFLKKESLEGPIYDLGCGFGGVLEAVSKQTRFSIIGFEKAYLPMLFLKLRYGISANPRVHVTFKDFFSEDLSGAKIIFCYLYPGAMKLLKDKIDRDNLKNVICISNTFALPGQKPDLVIQTQDLYASSLYVYKL